MKRSLSYYRLLLLFWGIFSLKTTSVWAQKNGLIREMAILNVQGRESDFSTSFQYSAEHIAQVAGIPYIITTEPEIALQYSIILSTKEFLSTTFSPAEKTLLRNYVSQGGIWIVARMNDPELYDLFGIQSYISGYSNETAEWDLSTAAPETRWINDDYEQTISIGDPDTLVLNAIKTFSYTTNTAEVLASFPDGGNAVFKNSVGTGYAYTLGFSLKDLILSNQLETETTPFRMYSNGFEPTSDVLILFIRAIYQTHIPAAVWKHTAPLFAKSVLMITHDVDSQTSMDTMNYFAEWENAQLLRTTYNINTKTFHDLREDSFYTQETIPLLQELVSKNQAIGNHSFGHFPDFNITSRFPYGSPGNTPENYMPYYTHSDSTIGGTAYGEIELSDFLLKRDLGVVPRIWRSGHLANHPDEAEILKIVGYNFTSTYSANGLLTNFPFHLKKHKSFTGETLPIIEIPMTISDVFHPIDAGNIDSISSIWHSVIQKNRDNYSPVVLLIHPNRQFKLLGEQRTVGDLPSDVLIMEMSEFGDYWNARENLKYHTDISSGTLTITLENELPINPLLSLMIENSNDFEQILVQTANGNPVDYRFSQWNEQETLLSFDTLSAPEIRIETNKYFCETQNVPIDLHFSGHQPFNLTYKLNDSEFSLRTNEFNFYLTSENPDSFKILKFYDASGRNIEILPPKILFSQEFNPIPEFSFSVDEETVLLENQSQNSIYYLWDFGDENFSSEFEPKHKYAENGIYSITLTSENNSCEPQSIAHQINIATLQEKEIKNTELISVFPNPFDDCITFNFCSTNEKTAQIEIFNEIGISIYKINVYLTSSNDIFTIQLPEKLNSGIYFAKITFKNSFHILKVLKTSESQNQAK